MENFKIIMKNIASYGENPAILETDKKVNLLYGLNGSGKTIVSNYLKNFNENGVLYPNCSIEGFDPSKEKILVYNQKFVEEIFYLKPTQKGIFTVRKDNKEAMENIDQANQKKEKLEQELEKQDKNLQDKNQQIQNNKDSTMTNTWEIIKKYTGGDRIFDTAGFLNGLKGKKEVLFSHLIKTELKTDTLKTLDNIKKELSELGRDATKRERLSSITLKDIKNIEEHSIFSEEIIGNENSTASALINELKNSDWVKIGIDNYIDLDKRKNCPFCQQETLTEKLVKDIKNYFDKTYEEKIKQLQEIRNTYQTCIESFNRENYVREFFTEEQKAKIDKLFSKLTSIFDANISNITKKIETPSQKITLKSSSKILVEINKFLEDRNQEIDEFNEKLDNRDKEIEKLKEEFWAIQRKEYDTTIKNYANTDKKLQKENKDIETEKENIKKQITEQDNIIINNQQNITNIDEVIKKINQHLLDFGIEGFEIIKHGDNEYKIKRKSEDDTQFQTLSEGEKTVISFLYFIELCIGQENQNDLKKKIIVIDDPISSLSHMYVFNISELIKQHITTKESDFLRIFVFTHNLYFFNELIDRKSFNKDREERYREERYQKLFRITKGTSSAISEMKPNEIQNEYQAYWDIVREYTKNSKFIVANAMRNIIEYFFGFVEKQESINNIFQKIELSDIKYQAFKRYIDRESHSNPTNISDYKNFDCEIFQEAFKLIFKEAGYEKHYNTMIPKK